MMSMLSIMMKIINLSKNIIKYIIYLSAYLLITINRQLTKHKFTRKIVNNEITKTKVDKIVEETTKINPDDLINPLEQTRSVFFFRVHVSGYIESGNVSIEYLFYIYYNTT